MTKIEALELSLKQWQIMLDLFNKSPSTFVYNKTIDIWGLKRDALESMGITKEFPEHECFCCEFSKVNGFTTCSNCPVGVKWLDDPSDVDAEFEYEYWCESSKSPYSILWVTKLNSKEDAIDKIPELIQNVINKLQSVLQEEQLTQGEAQ